MWLLFRPSTNVGRYVIVSGLKLQPLSGSRRLSDKSELIRMKWAERLEKDQWGIWTGLEISERQRGNWNCALPHPLCPFSPHLRKTSHHCLPFWIIITHCIICTLFDYLKLTLVLCVCASAGNEGSAENGQKETSTCDICQFGAECDVDAEDVWWVR